MTMKTGVSDKKSPKGPERPLNDTESLHEDEENYPSTSSASIPLLASSPGPSSESGGDGYNSGLPTYDESVAGLAVSPDVNVVRSADDPPLFSEYVPPFCESKDGTIACYDQHVNNESEALYQFLVQQNRQQPKPMVQLRGTHTETRHVRRNGKNETESTTVTDFDMKLDMSDLLILKGGEEQPGFLHLVAPGDKVYRGGMIRRRDSGVAKDGTGSIRLPDRSVRDWVNEYCSNTSSAKEFRMKKVTPGYDHAKLQRLLTELIQSTNYRGSIFVTFPVEKSVVYVRPSNKFTYLRFNPYVRWFCYLTFLWILTWPVLWIITHRYDVVRSTWPMSIYDSQGRKMYIMDEESWFHQWRPAIRHAVLGKRKGWVTEQDLIELAELAGQPRPQMPNTGNSFADGVIGGSMNLFSMWQHSRMMAGWGSDTADNW